MMSNYIDSIQYKDAKYIERIKVRGDMKMTSAIRISVMHASEERKFDAIISESTTGRELVEDLIKRRIISSNQYRLGVRSKGKTIILDIDGSVKKQLPSMNTMVQVLPLEKQTPLSALFLGPKAENEDIWKASILHVLEDYIYWRKNYFPKDPVAVGTTTKAKNAAYFDEFDSELQNVLSELKEGFPFHSPRYMGHMLSGQTLPSVIGYFAGMLYNPNNVTDEAAPITVAKEVEYGKMICRMIGYTSNSWAHLCSGGTLANLEALWIARLVQFLPLCIREVCLKQHFDFFVKTPNYGLTNNKVNICDLDIKTLISLQPNESLFMVSNLLRFMIVEKNYSIDVAQKLINTGIENSRFNVRKRGFHMVMDEITKEYGHPLKPVFFIPESAHYSFKKAVNVLGYGENAIRNIPITSKFRIDIEGLNNMVSKISDDEYIAAVVAVVGTTEEGAVDPVHKIKWLRDEIGKMYNRSFWLHVDAAWGGFIRTLFCDEFSNEEMDTRNGALKEDYTQPDFERKINNMITKINANEIMYVPSEGGMGRKVTITWSDTDVYAAFMAMKSADSVTVDPHKLGYIPYPAGLIAFKNKLVTTLVAQDAPYISTSDRTIAQVDIREIDGVGSYILEGSKPGAAALSCWLSAKMIPLDMHHHGKIIKTSLLNAKRLAYCLMTYHRCFFREIDDEFVNRKIFFKRSERPFIFKLLYSNIDTNVVCFTVLPAYWRKENKKEMEIAHWNLEKVNHLNEIIYKKFTINPLTREDDRKETMSQRFFISKTKLGDSAYAYASIKSILSELGYTQEEYSTHGLFVMRLTLMNPWYYVTQANDKGIDYFMEFLKELHYQSRKAIESLDATPNHIS